jgi:hypothetical protein
VVEESVGREPVESPVPPLTPPAEETPAPQLAPE